MVEEIKSHQSISFGVGAGGMERPTRPCAGCGVEGAPRECPCKGVFYCGRDCQKASWKEHKKSCSVFLANELVAKRREHWDDAIQVGLASGEIGTVFLEHGLFEDAEMSYQEAVRIFRIVHGNRHADVAGTLLNLGQVYREQGKCEDARQMYKDALRIFRSAFGDQHVRVANVLNSIGCVCQLQGKFEEAAERYDKALAIYRAAYGDEHELVAMVLGNLGDIYDRIGMPDEAMVINVESLRVLRSSSL